MKGIFQNMNPLLIALVLLSSPNVFASEGKGGGHGNPGCGCPTPGPNDCASGVKISGIVNINSKARIRPYSRCQEGEIKRAICLYEYGGIFFGNHGTSVYATHSPDGVIRGIENAHLKRLSGYRKYYLADENYEIIPGPSFYIRGRLDSKDYLEKDGISRFDEMDPENSSNLAEAIDQCSRLARDYGYSF